MKVVPHAHRMRANHVRGNFVLGARPATERSEPIPELGWPSLVEWDEMVESCEDEREILSLMGRYVPEKRNRKSLAFSDQPV